MKECDLVGVTPYPTCGYYGIREEPVVNALELCFIPTSLSINNELACIGNAGNNRNGPRLAVKLVISADKTKVVALGLSWAI